MDPRGQVLVVILNNLKDFDILHKKHWYRIPITIANKRLKKRWPPEWLAFYQTKVFGEEAFAVNYYAKVLEIREVYRYELFPDEPRGDKTDKKYYQIFVQPLQRLPKPILSRRWRLIIFIPTTWSKLIHAVEINDLYDESSLEDRLWAEFKRLKISAERQEFVSINKNAYFLDFALYCSSGKIDVETDGNIWHANPERAAQDNIRDNDLKTTGWSILRFNDSQIQEQMEEYCLPTIAKNINNFGGVKEGKIFPRRVELNDSGTQQLSLFDDL